MASHRPVVLNFKQIDKYDLSNVGVKAVSFSEMLHEGILVPDGFAVTVEAHERFLEENILQEEIYELISAVDRDNPEHLQSTSEIIQKKIRSSRIPEYVSTQISSYYKKLSGRFSKASVVVRSSNKGAEQTNFFNVKGETHLLESIKECWASHYTAHAIFQSQEIKTPIVVQEMINPEASGLVYSIDPVYRDNDSIIIEAVWGLGEVISLGLVVPDTYSVKKGKFKILSKEISEQRIQIISKKGKVKETKVSKKNQSKQKIADDDIKYLSKQAEKLQHYYYFPQEVRWAKQGKDIYITQTRQLTSVNRSLRTTSTTKDVKMHQSPVLTGAPASEGVSEGLFRLIETKKDLKNFKSGEILITHMTNPEYLSAIKIASAIVTDEGGLHSHAATVSRELSIPCIVGTKTATTKLKNGFLGIVDGARGEVYIGSKVEKKSKTKRRTKRLDQRTVTGSYVEISDNTDAIEKYSKRNFDGLITSDLVKLSDICQLFKDTKVIYKAKESLSELESFQHIAQDHNNLQLMLSGPRDAKTLRSLRRRVATAGLFDNPDFELWLNLDLPAQIISLKRFASVGLSGIYINTDRLTQLSLGVDEVDIKSTSLLWMIKRSLRIARDFDLQTSIGGYLPTHSEDIVEKAVKYGVTNIAVNPGVLNRVRSVIVRAEREFIS